MRAVLKRNPTSEGVEVEDVATPKITAPDQVLVRVAISSISGSELNVWKGTYRLPNGSPVADGRILGYEHAGVVEAAGDAAGEAGYQVGSLVALGSPFIGCGRCEPCGLGLINRCRAWGHIGITQDGTNAELALLPMSVLEKVPDGLDLVDAAFLNSAALAVRAVRRSGLVPGDRVGVVGPGPVGLLLLQVARAAGASWIALVGRDNDLPRLEIGTALGADTSLVAEEATDAVKAVTEGLGVEVVLEAAGTPDAVRLSVDLARVGGTVVLAGLPPERMAPIEAIRVTRDELTIRGVEGNLPDDRARALRLMTKGDLLAHPFVTHRFALDEAEDAFKTVLSGSACKAVFSIGGG